MGYLLIDHSAGQGIDHRQGVKQEYDTRTCTHCGTLIALLVRPTETLHISAADIAVASTHAPHVSTQYTAKHRCSGCKRDVCRACAGRMALPGARCPGPVRDRIRAAIERARRSPVFPRSPF